MAKKVQWIVVTDLDASLLDESYSYDAATETLEALQAKDIPVVWNSSKTLDEMIKMTKDWKWKSHPFWAYERKFKVWIKKDQICFNYRRRQKQYF